MLSKSRMKNGILKASSVQINLLDVAIRSENQRKFGCNLSKNRQKEIADFALILFDDRSSSCFYVHR